MQNRYAKYMEDPLNTDEAEAFAVTAWAFYQDWTKEFFPSRFFQIELDVMRDLPTECSIIKEIANSYKHIGLTRPPHKILVAQEVKGGAFDQSFSDAFDITRLNVILSDGTNVGAKQVFTTWFSYWKTYFETELA